MKKKILWVILIGIVSFIAGYNHVIEKFLEGNSSKIENGVFINNSYGFEFTIPQNWNAKELKNKPNWKLIIYKYKPGETGDVTDLLPSIYFNFQDAKSDSLIAFVDRFIASNKSKIPNFNILSQNTKEISIIGGVELIYTGDLSARGIDFGRGKFKQVFLVRNNVFYNLLFMARINDYDNDIQEFDNLVNSFRFTK